jgi:hypothetical protein
MTNGTDFNLVVASSEKWWLRQEVLQDNQSRQNHKNSEESY